MFRARIEREGAEAVLLGPTDSRDEASRLARAWMTSPARGGGAYEGAPTIGEVRIERYYDRAEAGCACCHAGQPCECCPIHRVRS